MSYIVIFLSNINYIAKSPKDAQETIAQHCVFKTFHTGECICRAGQIPDYFGIIVNGRVDVIPPNFNNIVINVLLANDVYGDSELLLGTAVYYYILLFFIFIEKCRFNSKRRNTSRNDL